MKEHTVDIRVRYEETDKMGVVYYAKYFVWFEIARTEFFRELGIVYRDIEDQHKIYLPVVEAFARYRHPLQYDNIVQIKTTLDEIGLSKIVFKYEVLRDSCIMTTGTTKHAFINQQGAPIPIPAEIKSCLQKQ